ncbi:MAG: PAS domain S-box protein [Deltaproteobacteria bacterium]|jgi:PAS domain S-box-containing protein|nr:PAS domain S-box protein [Deltaproteobacteria bacterium]
MNKIYPGLKIAVWMVSLLSFFLMGKMTILAQNKIQQEKRIVVLHSMETNRPLQIYFNKYFRDEMNRLISHPYELNFESLDLIRFNDIDFKNGLKQMLIRKYTEFPVDLLVIVLPQAAQFVSDFEIFPDVPKVYITPKYIKKEKFKFPSNAVVGIFGYDLNGNIKHSLDLFPDTKTIFVVSGAGITDKSFETMFREDTQEFTTRVSFNYLAGLDIEELMRRVENLPEHSLVYYLTYTKDPANRPIYAVDVAGMLGLRSNRPVFSFLSILVSNQGILGGRITSVKSMGIWAATVAWRILTDENISPIGRSEFSHEYLYDWEKINKWGIDSSTLPQGSVIQNRKIDFLESYKLWLIGGLSLLVIESAFIFMFILNIIRRKSAESDLAIEKEFTLTLIDTSPAFFVVIGTQGELIMISKSMLNATGFSKKEVIGAEYLSTFIPERDQANVSHVFEKLRIQKHGSVTENFVLTKDGRELVVEWHGHPKLNIEGQANHFYGVGIDITDRKKADEILRKNEMRYRSLFESAKDGIAILETPPGQDPYFSDCNKNILTLFRCEKEDFIGNSPMEFSPPRQPDSQPSREKALKVITAAAAGRPQQFEWTHCRSDGTLFVAEVSLHLVYIGDESSIYVIIRDKTKSKLMEAAFHESEERFRAIFNNAPVGIIQADLNGNTIVSNLEYQRMLGYTQYDLNKMKFVDYTHPEDAAFSCDQYKQLASGAIDHYQLEKQYFHHKGHFIWVNIYAALIKDDNDEPQSTITMAVDVTGRKQDETELKKYREELEELVHHRTKELIEAKEMADSANQAKSEFLANMSHELRTPLNAIMGYSQIMQREKTLTDTQKNRLNIINQSGKHLLSLINDVLEMARIESGRASVVKKGFNLFELLKTLENSFSLKAKEKGLILIFNFEKGTPQNIITDEGKLRQILYNLISNAIKFTDKGEVTIGVRFLYVTEAEQFLEFEIKDTGPGIASNEYKKLFSAFEQTQSGQQKQEGTGLGLAISQKFANILGGEIRFSSQEGLGSIFRVRIKVMTAKSDWVSPKKPNRQVVGLQPDQKRFLILIVEDDDNSRNILADTIKFAGFDVIEASNGQEGINLFRFRQPDLIFMDMRMPLMDGFQATQDIKNTNGKKSPPIIAVTAIAFEEDKVKVLESGCDGYIRKPVQANEIYDALHKYLGVQFVYEEIKEVPSIVTHNSKVKELDKDLLKTIPDELREELKEYTVALNLNAIQELVKKIRLEGYPNIAEGLKNLTDDFKFDKIRELLD